LMSRVHSNGVGNVHLSRVSGFWFFGGSVPWAHAAGVIVGSGVPISRSTLQLWYPYKWHCDLFLLWLQLVQLDCV
jgi:hypothetical protein